MIPPRIKTGRYSAIVIASVSAEERNAYLNIASQLLPLDYGVDEYRIKDAIAAQDFNTALKYTTAMLANHSDKLYVLNVALSFAIQLNSDNKLLESRLKFKLQETLSNFFTIPDTTQKLLEKTVAQAKR